MAEITPTSSTALLRQLNASEILRHAWSLAAFTATELIAATGLTRSTVIGVCDDLVALGWLRELQNQRETGGGYVKGRPARRYEFAADAGVVVGVDAGEHTITVVVADLRGAVLTTYAHAVVHFRATAEVRRRDIVDAVDHALTLPTYTPAGPPASLPVLAVALGVPAPTDADGHSPHSNDGYWQSMNPSLPDLFDDRGWPVLVDNDANLAALAEGWLGAGSGAENYIALLSGERLGAGIVSGGALLRGATGATGEMGFLDLVAGVGSADGIGKLARVWGGRPAEEVFRAAEAGDEASIAVVDRLVARFARVFAILAGLTDADLIIVCGAVAASLDHALALAGDRMPDLMTAVPPRLVASTLGERAVSLGAVRGALNLVQSQALDISLKPSARPVNASHPSTFPGRISANVIAASHG